MKPEKYEALPPPIQPTTNHNITATQCRCICALGSTSTPAVYFRQCDLSILSGKESYTCFLAGVGGHDTVLGWEASVR